MRSICFGAEAPEVVLIHVPPGWTSETEGYYLNTEALSSLTAAAKTYRLESDTWEGAYYELSDKSKAFADEMAVRIDALKSQIEEERSAWRSAVRKARAPGFGLFGGIAHTGEAVIGVGLVWRLF
jgi:hypothetical protein